MAGGVISGAQIFGLTIRESADDGSDFTNPGADYRRFFLGEDGTLKLKDSSGTVTSLGGSGIPATIFAAKGDILCASANDTAAIKSVGTDGYSLIADSGQSTGLNYADRQRVITTSSNLVTGDTTMTNANQFYDGAALSINGTYILMGSINLRTTAAIDMTAKLWNGTTVATSGSITIHANTYTASIHLSAVVTTSGSETWKISAAGNGTTGTIKAATVNNGAGNNATYLYAIKIA